MSRYISIQWKILTPVIIILVLIVSIVDWFSITQQKSNLLRMTEAQMHDVINGYLDGMTTMMFTGVMSNREMLRTNVEKRDEVLELRMIRGEAVTSVYGPGFESENAQDDLDKKALRGEAIRVQNTNDEGRVLTLLQPVLAVASRNGTNCLDCHAVSEGTVLGAIRISYSLAARDQEINRELIKSTGIHFIVFSFGVAIIYLIMSRVVIQPIRRLKETMSEIGANADLRLRVTLGANDELREVGAATNAMLDRFQPAIQELSDTMEGLNASAQSLAGVTRETRDGAESQLNETSQLAESINQLYSAAENVSQNAVEAEHTASSAKIHADEGNNRVKQVVVTIQNLAEQVNSATSVVTQLAEGTRSIDQVSQAISDIAEQTNLLALNAAIEAARAGEQGRGFAVVADEVRNLSIRTQESTQEIKNIIAQLVSSSEKAVQEMGYSKHQAEQCVEDSNHTGEALQQIALGVENIKEMNSKISIAAAEQSRVVSEINKNIQAISGVTQKTAEGANTTLQESEEIAKIARKLDETANQFKV